MHFIDLCTKNKEYKGLQGPKRKIQWKLESILTPKFQWVSNPLFGLDEPISSFSRIFHSVRETALLSKMAPFLTFQIVHAAVMKISLKMWLPKFILAFVSISWGGRSRSQSICSQFQQDWLKAHVKNKCKHVSSGLRLQRAQA